MDDTVSGEREDETSRAVGDLLRSAAPLSMPAEVEARLLGVLQAEQNARERRGAQALARAADPGPMPAQVEDRIGAALAALAAERSASGEVAPRAGRDAVPGVREAATPAPASVLPFIRPARRRSRLVTASVSVAGVAAAAVAGAVVVNVVKVTPARTTDAIHVERSTEKYGASDFGADVHNLLDTRGSVPATPGSGPLTTAEGLQSCLRGLGVSGATRTAVDLATYDGQPAAIIAVVRGDSTTAYVVSRTCTEKAPGVIVGPTAVP